MADSNHTETESLDPRLVDLLTNAFAEWERMVDSQFGKGAWNALGGGKPGSYNAIFLDNPRPPLDAPENVQQMWQEQRDHELDILARGLVRRWKLQDPADRRLLFQRAEEYGRSRADEKLDLMKVGLLWASSEMRNGREVKLGRHSWLPDERQKEWSVDYRGVAWLPFGAKGHRSEAVTYGRGKNFKGEEGKIILVEPAALPYPERLAWFTATAKRAAEAALRDEPWATTSQSAADENMFPLEDSLQEIDVAAIEDALYGVDVGLSDILAACELPPAEQELLDAYLEYGDWLVAGKKVGLKPAATRKRKERLMEKLAVATA